MSGKSGPPVVSVVCATYRRPQEVERLLAALQRQDLGLAFEVILSDDGSGAECVARLRKLAAASPLCLTLLEHSVNRGAASARNEGWLAASARTIAFTDDDCQPASDWLRRGLEAHGPTGAVVVGRVLPDPAQAGLSGPWSRSLTVSDARFFQTANAFYSRQDLVAVGGFDPQLARGGEDTDLGLRVRALGRPCLFAAEALVLHDVRPGTVWGVARERATRWVDLPLVIRKHPAERATYLYRTWFWKRSHPPVLLALLGLLITPFSLVSPMAPVSLALVSVWLVDRGLRHPPARPWKRRLWLLPGTFIVDAAEVVAMVRGSVRHRTVVL